MTELTNYLINLPTLEIVGLVSGIGCVWLLIKENIWTFPVGLIYAAVSVVIFAQGKLYADVMLNAYYVGMNAYGWYYWLYGGKRSASNHLSISRMPFSLIPSLTAITVIGALGMGWTLDTITDASLPYWDSITTSGSFLAMWMTARKYIENWFVWLFVDIISTVIYLAKGIELYSILYALYMVMAILGWIKWKRNFSSNQ